MFAPYIYIKGIQQTLLSKATYNHQYTQRRRSRPCRATASSYGAFRVRCSAFMRFVSNKRHYPREMFNIKVKKDKPLEEETETETHSLIIVTKGNQPSSLTLRERLSALWKKAKTNNWGPGLMSFNSALCRLPRTLQKLKFFLINFFRNLWGFIPEFGLFVFRVKDIDCDDPWLPLWLSAHIEYSIILPWIIWVIHIPSMLQFSWNWGRRYDNMIKGGNNLGSYK